MNCNESFEDFQKSKTIKRIITRRKPVKRKLCPKSSDSDGSVKSQKQSQSSESKVDSDKNDCKLPSSISTDSPYFAASQTEVDDHVFLPATVKSEPSEISNDSNWKCIVCQNVVLLSEKDLHLETCIKTYEHKLTSACICDVCKIDITCLSMEEKCKHVNACLDAGTLPNAVSQEVSNPPTSVTITECPLCLKNCSSAEARLAHIKKCSQGTDVKSVITAIHLQQKHMAERISLGLPILQKKPVSTSSVSKAPKKVVKEPKTLAEENMQLAKALSLSLKEEQEDEEKQDLNHIDLTPFCFTRTNIASGSSAVLKPPELKEKPGKKKKKNVDKPVPVLLLRTEDDRQHLLEDRISSIISVQPTLETEAASGAPNEECHLWTLSGEAKEKDDYYVKNIGDFVTPSEIETGSKLRNLSQVPGHRIYTQQPCNFTFNSSQDIQQDNGRVPEIPSTQEMIDVIIDGHDENDNPCENIEDNAESKEKSDGFFVDNKVSKEPTSVVGALETLVGNSWMSDVTVVTSGDSPIPAHGLLLKLRCPSLRNMDDMLDWSNYSQKTALHFLHFVYTGVTNWESDSNEEIGNLAKQCGIDVPSVTDNDISLKNNETVTEIENPYANDCDDVLRMCRDNSDIFLCEDNPVLQLQESSQKEVLLSDIEKSPCRIECTQNEAPLEQLGSDSSDMFEKYEVSIRPSIYGDNDSLFRRGKSVFFNTTIKLCPDVSPSSVEKPTSPIQVDNTTCKNIEKQLACSIVPESPTSNLKEDIENDSDDDCVCLTPVQKLSPLKSFSTKSLQSSPICQNVYKGASSQIMTPNKNLYCSFADCSVSNFSTISNCAFDVDEEKQVSPSKLPNVKQTVVCDELKDIQPENHPLPCQKEYGEVLSPVALSSDDEFDKNSEDQNISGKIDSKAENLDKGVCYTISNRISSTNISSDEEVELLPLHLRLKSNSKEQSHETKNLPKPIPPTEDSSNSSDIQYLCELSQADMDFTNDVFPMVSFEDKKEESKVCSAARTPVSTSNMQKDFIVSSSPITPLPDFKTMVTPQIKEQLKKYGIRVLPRKKAVAILTHIYDETHPWVDVVDDDIGTVTTTQQPSTSQTTQSSQTAVSKKRKLTKKTENELSKRTKTEDSAQQSTKEDDDLLSSPEISSSLESSKSDLEDVLELSDDDDDDICTQRSIGSTKDAIRNYIRSNNSLYSKVLMYEPLNLTDFHQELKGNGIKISSSQLTDFLDEECITFTMPRSEKFKKKQQNRCQKFRKKMISQLSQQQ